MTIGSLPPPVSHRDVAGRLTPPALKPGRNEGDADGFAQALRTITTSDACARTSAERFNEHGFFTDTSISTGKGAATPVKNPDQQESGAEALTVAIAPNDPTAFAETFASEAESSAIGPPTAKLSLGVSKINNRPTAGRHASEANVPDLMVQTFERPVTGSIEAENSVSPVRAAKPRLPATSAAKSPVSVALNSREGAAAVTVSAQRLADCDIDALRTDIAALLRRHGLVLDDFKLNGRPMGRDTNDRSGG